MTQSSLVTFKIDQVWRLYCQTLKYFNYLDAKHVLENSLTLFWHIESIFEYYLCPMMVQIGCSQRFNHSNILPTDYSYQHRCSRCCFETKSYFYSICIFQLGGWPATCSWDSQGERSFEFIESDVGFLVIWTDELFGGGDVSRSYKRGGSETKILQEGVAAAAVLFFCLYIKPIIFILTVNKLENSRLVVQIGNLWQAESITIQSLSQNLRKFSTIFVASDLCTNTQDASCKSTFSKLLRTNHNQSVVFCSNQGASQRQSELIDQIQSVLEQKLPELNKTALLSCFTFWIEQPNSSSSEQLCEYPIAEHFQYFKSKFQSLAWTKID